jgi:hypothetical protein
VDDVDIAIYRFEVSEIAVSNISGDKIRILRKVEPESWCHSDHAVTASHRSVAWLIGRMNDQEATEPPELFV